MLATGGSVEKCVPDSVQEQYDTVHDLYARRAFYNNAVPPIDFVGVVADQLKLRGDETILDVGAADARVQRGLHKRFGHFGRMIGLDINPLLFAGAIHDVEQPNYPLELVVGEAQHLSIADSSVDVVLALFLLYHVPNPENALREFTRVLRPDGQLLVATSNQGNKPRHRELEAQLANHFKTTRPPLFAAPFDDKVARTVLPQFFDEVQEQTLCGEVHITPSGRDNSYADYIFSLLGMKRSFGGDDIPRAKWDKAIERQVRPIMIEEERANGHFTDYYGLNYFVCRNPRRD